MSALTLTLILLASDFFSCHGAAFATSNPREHAHESIVSTFGETVILHCSVSSEIYHSTIVQWIFQDANEVLTQGKFLQTLNADKRSRYSVSIGSNFDLRINNVQSKDIGTYICRSTVSTGKYETIATRVLFADSQKHHEAPVMEEQNFPEHVETSDIPKTGDMITRDPPKSGENSQGSTSSRHYDALSVFGLISGIALMIGIVGSIAWKNGKKSGRKHVENKASAEEPKKYGLNDSKSEVPLRNGRMMRGFDSDPNLVKASGFKY
ncbi:uncharacterized protein LOC117120871 [Anneissia japonica]|uniref:uncharacterized protein LOC117120871 n=1 Tax=Anneissia japonica TaxID=1529436 RepID=UPI001425B1D2|nr:uncharacterized protein LOC117120871 [Anneissia japonica]